MSDIQYGLISKVDACCLEKTMDLICEQFKDEVIFITEIGVYNGRTSKGMDEYLAKKGRRVAFTRVDNKKDGEEIIFFPQYHIDIIGNSNEVCHKLYDNCEHLIFIDGSHAFADVISDFFCYAPKITKGGYLAFHDTGKHIGLFTDFQHGHKDNPDAYISCRKALEAIGLFRECEWQEGFELVFDEADESDNAGGICVFRKL